MPVHPVDLSGDGHTLAVTQAATGRLEILDTDTGTPVKVRTVRVGQDPVTVRFRTATEAWVVNQISSTLNVVDVSTGRILALIPTQLGPGDVVFAGQPLKAYVSCVRANCIQVFDPITYSLLASIPIKGDRPQALATSPDGLTVYAAIFESGNSTTIIAPELTDRDTVPPAGALSDAAGPYGGQDPPPNSGTDFDPPINPHLDASQTPRGSLIVRKMPDGRWMDDNRGDWSDYITGNKAYLTGRSPGWDMPDRDLAMISTATHDVAYATRLMNLCMAVAVNPVTGTIQVAGTDAMNHIRFEPRLQGNFLRVELATVVASSLTATTSDLNPHLDYSKHRVAQNIRDLSIGDPRGMIWNAAGTKLYITGMGSRNLIVLDNQGQRIASAPTELGEGPVGLVLDEPRHRLYVLNHFSNSLSVVDASSLVVLTTVELPQSVSSDIREGQRLFFDTRSTSGLGQASCASCHPDGRMDRLAWDLGVPDGEMEIYRQSAIQLHPMKGPMVTLSLRTGMKQPHWRGDRSFEDFAFTFQDLLGADQLPTHRAMSNLRAALEAMPMPPNPNRTLADQLPTALPLPGHYQAPAPEEGPIPLPAGNAQAGRDLFSGRNSPESPNRCSGCHPAQTGEVHNVHLLGRNDLRPFIPKSLLSLNEKMGMSLEGSESRAGFGFLHDGRIDTLSRYLQKGFGIGDARMQADLIAFLLSFGGADGSLFSGDDFHPGGGVHAAVGKQVMATNSAIPDNLSELIAVLDPAAPWSSRIDLIAWQHQELSDNAWFYDPPSQRFLGSERPEDAFTTAQLLAQATPDAPILFMTVEGGRGRRESIDWDGDGIGNSVEIAQGSDPLDFYSPVPPPVQPPRFLLKPVEDENALVVTVYPGMSIRHQLGTMHPLNQFYNLTFGLPDPLLTPPGAAISDENHFVWTVPADAALRRWDIPLAVTSSRIPTFTSTGVLSVHVKLPSAQVFLGNSSGGLKYDLLIPGVFHEVETSGDLVTWKKGWRFHAIREGSGSGYEFSSKELPIYRNEESTTRRFYRVRPISGIE